MIVYLLINRINLKCYIGQHATNCLRKRWNARLSSGLSSGHLSAAINKYGPQNFNRLVLAYCRTQRETDVCERYWIGILQTYDRRYGYNLQFGGKRGAVMHTLDVRRRISEALRASWAKKSKEERNRHAERVRAWWARMSAEERERIGKRLSNDKKQEWAKRPKEKHERHSQLVKDWWAHMPPDQRKAILERQRITQKEIWACRTPEQLLELSRKKSKGLRKYHASKRDLPEKKPVMSTKSYSPEIYAANRKQSRLSSISKGGAQPMLAKVIPMPAHSRACKAFLDLSKEAVEIIQNAYESLERGGTVKLAKQQLRDVSKRLTALEREYRGGCSW